MRLWGLDSLHMSQVLQLLSSQKNSKRDGKGCSAAQAATFAQYL